MRPPAIILEAHNALWAHHYPEFGVFARATSHPALQGEAIGARNCADRSLTTSEKPIEEVGVANEICHECVGWCAVKVLRPADLLDGTVIHYNYAVRHA